MDVERYRKTAGAKMKDFIDTHKMFDDMRITDDKGTVIASSHAKTIGTLNVADRDYFKAAIKGSPFISAPLMNKTTGKPIMVISAPVKFDDEITGILYAVIDLGGFTEKYIDSI